MEIGRVKPQEIIEEMQNSYLDYAMSVIVGRALPDVRDGLKPVHRRILYAMWDMGLRSTSKLRKSATVVGECLGKYHPHGDMAVYDTLVRLAQSFSMRYPLIQGQGNFGSLDGDSAAAMRYCVAGDTLIVTEKGLMPIKEISSDQNEDIKLKILSRNRNINIASKWFDSGNRQIIKITTKSGLSLKGSYNHPILIWSKNCLTGQPFFQWKLLKQIGIGDAAVIDRASDVLWPIAELLLKQYWPDHSDRRTEKKILPEKLSDDLAFILGLLVSEGTIKKTEIEFCNSDAELIKKFEESWKKVFPDCRLHKFFREPNSFGKKPYYTLEIHSRQVVEFLQNIGLTPVKSAQKEIPLLIAQSPKSVASSFLRACFEGDGSISFSEKMTELSYISTSEDLIKRMQIILLRFGIFSVRRFDKWRRTHKLYIRGLNNYRDFKEQVGFVCVSKTKKLNEAITRLHKNYSQSDFVPYLGEFVRSSFDKGNDYQSWEFAMKHNFDRYSNMEQNYSRVLTAVRPPYKIYTDAIFENLLYNNYLFDPVAKKETCGKEKVYSLRVDSDCHSFIGNGFINHNTECRLTALAEEMMQDIDRDTVNWVENYDGTRQEPTVLPSKLPQLLLNGSVGIAVGMATNIPPHNLSELVDGITYLIANPKAGVEDLMKFIKGPDFPTGGEIYDKQAIWQTYSTGKGAIVTRAVAEIVEDKKGLRQIIVSEIPYQVNKATLLETIADLVKDKKVDGIKDIRDESDKDGVRVVVDLKSEAYPQKVLNRLYKLTDLQRTFHVNLLALTEEGLQPHVQPLKAALENYVEHRYHVITRRTQFDLARAKERAHILEGLKKALDHIDQIIATIKKSADKEEAHGALCKKFKLSAAQATAILEMKLQTLAGLERKKIEDELKEKRRVIGELEELLKSPKKILGVIKSELAYLKEKYGDERRTKVFASPVGEFKEEDLIPEEECIITLTQGGYVKRMNPKNYRAQKRGGKGVSGITTREKDAVKHMAVVNSHDNLLFFTSAGRVFQTKAYEIPEASRVARGQALVNFLQLGPKEEVNALVALKENLKNRKKGNGANGAVTEENFLVMMTKDGIIKKTAAADFANVRRSGLMAITLDKGDELRWVKASSGLDEIILVTAKGQSIRFKEKDVRSMGRSAAGVWGIRLKKGDEVIGMDIIRFKEMKSGEKKELLVVMENGYGKKTELKRFKVQKRGGSGIKAAQVTAKTGAIVVAKALEGNEEDIIAISRQGQVIRTAIGSISLLGRATQGVRIMKLEAGDKIASVTSL